MSELATVPFGWLGAARTGDGTSPRSLLGAEPHPITLQRLRRLLCRTPEIRLRPGQRLVIFSDLHLGDGGRRDDFRHNSALVMHLLSQHHHGGGYDLLLNGDVEELQNFSLASIVAAWKPFYDVLQAFESDGRLHKILGNHDLLLASPKRGYPLEHRPLESVKLFWNEHPIFIFHGHQASHFQTFLGQPCGYLVRHCFGPLGFRNGSLPHEDARKILLERRIYEFARRERMIAVIGHTHRPLFESLSKVDTLQFQIEHLCRQAALCDAGKREIIEPLVLALLDELRDSLRRNPMEARRSSLYGDDVVVPCLFNSGCAIGQRGVTVLEIEDGHIALVHWFDERRSGPRPCPHSSSPPEQLHGTTYHRVTIKRESLDYLFTRIRLLA